MSYACLQLEDNIDFLNIYDGGSTKDNQLISITGNSAPSEVKSLGSQVFIEFLANGNGAGKGFSASIKFGIRTKS